MNPQIAQVVVGLPVEGPFDYLIPKSLANTVGVGMRVRVSFGPRELTGFCVGMTNKSKFKRLKSIEAVLDNAPVVDEKLLSLCRRFSEFFGCSLGEAIETILPESLRRGKPLELASVAGKISQGVAGQGILGEAILLHAPARLKGLAWIFKRIKEGIGRGQGVIYLVPEVALIDEVLGELKNITDKVTVLDKRLSAKEELSNWQEVKEGRALITVGTRSAVFAPIVNLGLIVLAQEENSAYKQEQSPFYHARDIALLRRRIESCAVVLSSVAPSAESWALAQKKKMQLISFEEKPKSQWQTIDLNNYNPRKSSILSVPLRGSLQKVLDSGGKMMLWMNRKGFSSRTRCNQCGFALQCDRCDVHLTYFYSKKKLICRRCGKKSALPAVCPQCHGSYLRSGGTGVEKLESELSRIYPQARVEHFDKESPIVPKDFNVLIATQAVMKSVEHLNLNVIGVVQMDSELNRLDFRSSQRAFSLLVHLRLSAKEKLIAQTRLSDHYCLKNASKLNFKRFYQEELGFRKELGFPPYVSMISLGVRSLKEQEAFEVANDIFTALTAQKVKGMELMDPHPDIIPKLRDKYRFTVIVKGKKIKPMLLSIKKVLREVAKKKNVIVTMNPDYSPEVFLS